MDVAQAKPVWDASLNLQSRLWCTAVVCLMFLVVGCRDRSSDGESSRPSDRSPSESEPVWRQPTTDRAEQPKPADQEPTRPSTRSEGNVAVTPVTPLERAEVGQWAHYRMAGGFEQRLTVVERRPDVVVLRLEMWIEGTPTGLPAERREPLDLDWAMRAAERDDAEVVASETSLRVAEKDWPVRLTIARWRFEGVMYERRTWTSAAAPIYGVVRMILTADDKLAASMELVAWGQPSKNGEPSSPDDPS